MLGLHFSKEKTTLRDTFFTAKQSVTMLPGSLCFRVIAIMASVACGAQTAYAETALETILGSATNSSDYTQKMHRFVDDTERAIVHAGFGATMLMDLLDDEIEFGESDYWFVEVGTSGTTSIACALGGGIDATATRSDYRRVTGSLVVNNCVTTLGVLNGGVDFTFDDSIWDSQANPKIEYALKLTLNTVSLEAADGKTYRFSGGGAYCDSRINYPLRRYSFDPAYQVITKDSYGRDPEKQLLSDYEFYRGFTYQVEDSNGRLKENLTDYARNCDLKGIAVAVSGRTHTINDVKFTSSGVYGNSATATYHVSNGRDSRIASIASGDRDVVGGRPDSGSFSHAEFGRFTTSSGVQGFGDFGYQQVLDERYPLQFRVDYFFYRNAQQGSNTWSLLEGRLVGGESAFNLPDLNENGVQDSNERIENGFALSRGECAVAVRGNSEGAVDYFELERRQSLNEVVQALRSGTSCSYSNHWLIESASNGDYVSSFQLDWDDDGVHDFFDRDDDNDGVEDYLDAFPKDARETTDTDSDGIGNNADTDDDNDSVLDEIDAFPLDPNEYRDTDGDGVGNNADSDDDGDGYEDGADAFPLDASEWLDTDDDGIGNNSDKDDDNDGLSDSRERKIGTNGVLADTDGDSMTDGLEVENGLNPLDDSDCPRWYCPRLSPVISVTLSATYDLDKDGLTREQEETLGTDYRSADSDGDGLTDGTEVSIGSNPLLEDTDGDGLADARESELGSSPTAEDSDGDSMNDAQEIAEGLDPTDSSDCPRWFCGGGLLPAILGISNN